MQQVKIPDFPNYTVSEDGTVTNIITGKIKAHTLGKNGYYAVHLYHNGLCKRVYLHRILGMCFLPNPDNKRTINHKDGNKLNNSLANLEWATDSENIKHAHDTKLNKGRSKVTQEHLELIYNRFFSGETLTAISSDLPYNNVTVSNHFTAYIKMLGEEDKRAEQETINKNNRAKNAGINKRVTKSILMLTLDGVLVTKFNSLVEAKEFLNVSSSGPISNVLSGRQKTAYKHLWKCE